MSFCTSSSDGTGDSGQGFSTQLSFGEIKIDVHGWVDFSLWCKTQRVHKGS